MRDNRGVGPLIRAASLRGFADLVDGLGGDPDALLARVGIDPRRLADDDGLVPITAHDLVLDTAAEELGCPDLGLRLSAVQDLSVLGPLAVAIGASTTAREALECAARFLFVHSPALRIALEDDPLGRRGVVAVTYRKDLRESSYSPQGMELGLGVLHRVALALVEDPRVLRSVLVPHAPLSPVRRYLDHFGADVRFGGGLAALCVQRQVLERGFAGGNEVVRALAVDHLARHYRDPRHDLVAQVRLAVAETLRTSPPTVAGVAALLAVHPRTLQRRLAERGTSYAAVLDEVRAEAAHRYLTTTDLPVGQVALMLGYGEQSTLAHAVRRWHGTSPRGLRRAARPPLVEQ